MAPKWNVKFSLTQTHFRFHSRINGSKVECKVCNFLFFVVITEVLMAPKWNVKESKKERLLGVAEVLMAPKWNVKIRVSGGL